MTRQQQKEIREAKIQAKRDAREQAKTDHQDLKNWNIAIERARAKDALIEDNNEYEPFKKPFTYTQKIKKP